MNQFGTNFVSPAEHAFPRERRARRRYEMSLRLRWKVVRRKRLLETGTGMTLDLSSTGVLLQTDSKLPLSGTVELSIAWPILLDDALPMQLMVAGRIVRVYGRFVAIEISQYEFRTAGIAGNQLH